jgi:hypothetical protein
MEGESTMAIEDNLDQLYALYLANAIMSARMWGYFASLASKAEGKTEDAFLDRQIQMCNESVDAWGLEGHRDPERVRQMAKDAIRSAFTGIIRGPSSESELY